MRFFLLLLCIGTIFNTSTSLFLATEPDPSQCPVDSFTTCEATSTCCKLTYSNSGYGCCEEEGAVCCDGGTQPTGDPIVSCCPASYTCVQTSMSKSTCVPPTPSLPNQSAIQVCTPGPRYNPKNSTMNPNKLPSGIIIGDSVSIGYTPFLIDDLSKSFFLQHSPWAGGGGADDTGEIFHIIYRASSTELANAI